ncbi:UNVERIFIED_CONTAM: hypothetical protein Sindi_1681100, partial [Sesamum indicum]
SGFVPERSIGDNIMLAQELFTSYNQARLPSRCALKVDIRKAYDTVVWDFLLAALQLFGFPDAFTRWIKVMHLGFLQLIAQDMQFTYHWKCEMARVFQLGLADDLLLFC